MTESGVGVLAKLTAGVSGALSERGKGAPRSVAAAFNPI